MTEDRVHKLFAVPPAGDPGITEARVREIVREEIEWALKIGRQTAAPNPTPKAVRPRGPQHMSAERLARFRQLAELYESGKTILEVSHELGASPGTVTKALAAFGITPARGRPKIEAADERIEAMAAMRSEGQTLEQMAAHFCITRERVRQIMNKAGIETGKDTRPPTPEERAAAERYANGDSLILVAESLGVHQHTMRKLVERCGHTIRPSKRRIHELSMQRAEAAARLYHEGKTTREIADELGLPKAEMIYRYLALAGVKPTRKPGAGRVY